LPATPDAPMIGIADVLRRSLADGAMPTSTSSWRRPTAKRSSGAALRRLRVETSYQWYRQNGNGNTTIKRTERAERRLMPLSTGRRGFRCR
jgi:hypothetical protein